MMPMRSATASTSLITWLDMKTVRPAAAVLLTRSRKVCCTRGSSPEVGSSRTRSSARTRTPGSGSCPNRLVQKYSDSLVAGASTRGGPLPKGFRFYGFQHTAHTLATQPRATFGDFARKSLPLGEHDVDVDDDQHQITLFGSACICAARAS